MKINFITMFSIWGPHSLILMTGGEVGLAEVYILYPKNHNFRICLPKKISSFFNIPIKNPLVPFRNPKNSSGFFSRPKKILAAFVDPKYHYWPKFQTQKDHFDILNSISGWDWSRVLLLGEFEMNCEHKNLSTVDNSACS